MKLTRRFSGLLAVALAAGVITTAYAAGNWSTLPIVGGSSYCASTVSGVTLPAGQGPYGVSPGSTQGTGQSICGQTVPAGPPALTGTEVAPIDLYTPGATPPGLGAQPQTALLPVTALGNGYGGTTVSTTTGTQTPAVANGISTYIYAGAGAATFTTFTFPPNPFQNQKLCLVNAGTGIITLSALTAGTTGQLFAGTTPTSVPVQTAVGTAGTVTLGTNCWLYNASNTTWYRVL